MAAPESTTWEPDDHTFAKHEILRRYLDRWFPILGSRFPKIVYLDGFCGPGRYADGSPGSPLIALDVAKRQTILQRVPSVTFIFIERDLERLTHLNAELQSLDLPSNFHVRVRQGEFHVQLDSLLSYIESSSSQSAPTFAFLDPFGFSDIPFSIVQRLLRNPYTEVFINVMVDWINRFVEHPNQSVRDHISTLFGTDEASRVIAVPGDRVAGLRQLYQRQLSGCAQFVRYFEMRNRRNRVIYNLFFASNHRLGHVKMKEAFWAVDPVNGYTFSDASNPDQLVLLTEDHPSSLADDIRDHFAGQSVHSRDVCTFVEDSTPFLRSHMLAALKVLEARGDIQVAPVKADGTRRNAGQYPPLAVIDFP